MEFSYKGYLQLCQTAMENGYLIKNYHTLKTRESKMCILRHDVDFSLEKAWEMACFEQENEIFSTYFVLVSSDNYNIFSRKNQKILRDILAYGHTIGLHFDETVYGKDISENQLIYYIRKERDLLESILEKKVDTVSMHEPSSHILNMDLKIPDMINSYSKKYFHEYKYLSDSMMRWREDAETIVREGKYQKLHILTHPFWYQETEMLRKDILEEYINEASFVRKDMIIRYYSEII